MPRGLLCSWPPALHGEAAASTVTWGHESVCSLEGLCSLQHLPASDLSPGLCLSLLSVSLRPSSLSLLRMPLSPSCSPTGHRAGRRGIHLFFLSFCTRCHSGLKTAGKECPAQPLVAYVPSRWHCQTDVFIRTSLLARA